MTQMEKSLNRDELAGFKANEGRHAPMVPGLSCESPLRNYIVDKRELMKHNAIKANVLAAKMDLINAGVGGKHYNSDAPPGHWKPQHRRAQSNLDLQPIGSGSVSFE